MSWLILAATHIACFVGGLVVMRWLARRGLEAADHAVHHDTTTSREHVMPQRRAPLVIVSIVLGLVLFGVGVRVGYGLVDGRQDCLDTYANDLADSQEPRQKAAEVRDQRELEVFAATSRLLNAPAGDGEELRRALNAYLRASKQLDQQRAANPYPDPPREVCPSD